MSSDLLRLLGLSKRAGRLAQGEDMTTEAVQNHKARLLLLASDAAPGTVRRAHTLAGERLPVAVLPCDKAALGSALGRDTCAVCALTDMGLASKLAALIAAEDPSFAPAAEELARRQAKMARRKKEKPRKK